MTLHPIPPFQIPNFILQCSDVGGREGAVGARIRRQKKAWASSTVSPLLTPPFTQALIGNRWWSNSLAELWPSAKFRHFPHSTRRHNKDIMKYRMKSKKYSSFNISAAFHCCVPPLTLFQKMCTPTLCTHNNYIFTLRRDICV
jgi:hypothetical protein